MNPKQKNSLLVGGIAAGLASMPMTWMTIRRAQVHFEGGFGDGFGRMLNSAFQNLTVNVTGLNGTLTFLISTPLWFVIGVAIAANALQLMRSTDVFDVPNFVLWLFAIVSLVWVTVPILSALASGQATLGLGWFLGLCCVGTAIASLVMNRGVDIAKRPRTVPESV